MTASRETASHQSWLSTTFRLKINALTCWMEGLGTCNCWISQESKVHLHDKNIQFIHFFSGSIKKGIHLGRHLYTGIKTFSFLCARQRILWQKVSTKSWMAAISVFFTRILLLFGTRFHYSCKRRHDEEGKQSDEAAIRDLVLTFSLTKYAASNKGKRNSWCVYSTGATCSKEGMPLSPW